MAFWADGMAYVRAWRQEIALQEGEKTQVHQDPVQGTGRRRQDKKLERQAQTDKIMRNSQVKMRGYLENGEEPLEVDLHDF